MTDKAKEITKQEFEAYEGVRASGVTNMWDTETVSLCSGLSRGTVLDIIRHYDELNKLYPDVRR